MSNQTTVVMQPPSGESPSVLQLGPTNYQPDTSGHYTVPAPYVGQLLASGWQIVLTGNPPTHAP